jgi:membrane-associated protein
MDDQKPHTMETFLQLLEIVRHLDEHLARLSAQMGGWLYSLLFAIVFAETGLVIFPFLPGDSLLFAIGALVAVEGSGLSLPLMTSLLLIAAILGDAANYSIGRAVGPRVFSKEDSWLLNKKHLLKAEAFYQRHGGKAIFLARFAPLLRTFAPFVAGIGRMNLLRFWLFNISGGICWVVGFLFAGYYFGNIPAVKRNFEFVILGIVVVSLLPVAVEWYRSRKSPD